MDFSNPCPQVDFPGQTWYYSSKLGNWRFRVPVFCMALRAASLYPRTPARLLHVTASLQPLTRFCLLHVIASHVLATAHTSFLLHVIASQCAHWCGNPHPRRETWQAGTTSGKSAATFVFAQSTTLRYALPQGYGLSRRFAPGNDMQNLLRVSVCKHTSTFLQTPCVCLSWRRRSGCGTDRRTGRLSAAAGRGCPPPGCGRRQ